MEHPSVREKSCGVSRFNNTDRKIDIFSKTHFREATKRLVNIATNAHVKRARIKLIKFFLAASYASCSKERGHRVGYCFLCVAERSMCTVRATKSIAWIFCEFGINNSQIFKRHNDVRVKYNDIVSCCFVNAKVATLPWAAVFFHEILQV